VVRIDASYDDCLDPTFLLHARFHQSVYKCLLERMLGRAGSEARFDIPSLSARSYRQEHVGTISGAVVLRLGKLKDGMAQCAIVYPAIHLPT